MGRRTNAFPGPAELRQMETVNVDDLDNVARSATVTKHPTDPLVLSNIALNYYELKSGDSFSGGLHTHMNQEEVFCVLDGTATFEMLDEEITVESGEVIRFPPGEYQEGRNEGDERVRALAIGAPRESGETRTPLPCRTCGESDYHISHVHEDGITLKCPECSHEIDVYREGWTHHGGSLPTTLCGQQLIIPPNLIQSS